MGASLASNAHLRWLSLGANYTDKEYITAAAVQAVVSHASGRAGGQDLLEASPTMVSQRVALRTTCKSTSSTLGRTYGAGRDERLRARVFVKLR